MQPIMLLREILRNTATEKHPHIWEEGKDRVVPEV